MMGSWKTTVGRKLANVMNMEFIDTDDAIEEVTEMKVSDIFREFGEGKFREMETAFFKEKSKQSDQVFSTGGGIVLDLVNREILKNNGITFFLNAKTQTLANRMHDTSKRPLLINDANLNAQLEKIWDERKLYYNDSAAYIIDTDGLKPDEVLDEILNLLGSSIENH